MEKKQIEKKYELIKASMNKIEKSEDGELYVFIVGIDSYLKERNLTYCEKEARDFFGIFQKHTKIKKKNIYTLFNERASKKNILSQLDSFQNILNTNDRLVIYIAGHGHNTEFSNFFVPYDGYKNNFSSCISNTYIADSISSYHTSFVLFLSDFHFRNTEYKKFKEKISDNYYCLNEIQKDITQKKLKTPLYNDFITFLSKKERNRVKESFCFIKDNKASTVNTYTNCNWDIDKKLENHLVKYHKELLGLIETKKTKQVLDSLMEILENNDSDLYGRAETLKYKFDEISQKKHRKQDSEIIEERDNINEMTCELVERINDNNFFVIKTPKTIESGEKAKKVRTKILFTSANPRDEDFLRLDKEAKEIEYVLMKAKYRDDFEFIKKNSIHITEFENILLNESPQFVHFSGHGNCDGIALLNDYDNAQLVKAEPLARLLGLFSDHIQCVFLNSCHSIEQSKPISQSISKVICMGKEVPDEVAIHFACAFYRSIGAGRNIDFSFKFAKNSIVLNGIAGDDIPILLPLEQY